VTKKWTCSEPFNTAYLEQKSNSLTVAPCCVAIPKTYNPKHSLHDQPYLQQIRQDFKQGIVPSACWYCKYNEEKGLQSRRRQEPITNSIKNLEIHVGNYCNLKCVICTNAWSSAWKKDAKAMGLRSYENFKLDPDALNVDYSIVRWLHFNGGEPLFTNIHVNILERIPDPSKVTIYYNTNGTIRVKQSMFDLWSKFKLVKLIFSIDDVGQRFNYQRTNADWKTVQDNMFWYREVSPVNMMFGINRTISRLNNDYLPELDKWFRDYFPTNRLGDPNDFSEQLATGPTALNSKVYEDYIAKLNAIRS
jgi:organic radical activating enzyme